jgi:hypothetical protein
MKREYFVMVVEEALDSAPNLWSLFWCRGSGLSGVKPRLI